MQTLTFNSTTRIVKVYEGKQTGTEFLYEWDRVPTVKPIDTYYEVYQKNEFDKTVPVARFPISSTNMLIYS